MNSKSVHQILFYFRDFLESNNLELLKDTALQNIIEQYGSLVEFVDAPKGIVKYWGVFADQQSNLEPIEGLVTYDFYKEHRIKLQLEAERVITEVDRLVYSKADAGEAYTSLLKTINQEVHYLHSKAIKQYPSYSELLSALQSIENYIHIKYDVKPFAKKRAEDKLSYFGFKDTISRDKLIEIYDLADELGVIEYDEVDEQTFLEVLLENPSDSAKLIKFHCENGIAKQFLELLRPFFTALSPKTIEKSGRFLTKQNNTLKESNYNRTTIKSGKELDRLVRRMDAILKE